MITRVFCTSCFFFIFFVYQVGAFGSGAPFSTCYTQYPKHDGTPTRSVSTSPYKITFTPASYSPGQEITVDVRDTTGERMRGIQTAARRTTGNTDVIVGSFVEYPKHKLKVFNCFDGIQNMITHKNGHHVHNFTFKWKAPPNNVGDVVFRSTILRSYDVFWYDVMADLPVSSSTPLPVTPPKHPALPIDTAPLDVDLDSCGDTKGCFFYPRHCTGSDCIVASTFVYNDFNDTYSFELYTTYDVEYVSLGFSMDIWMGDDWTVSCTKTDGMVKESVQEGWNPGMYNERKLDILTTSRKASYKDGKLQCQFTLPAKFDTYVTAQGPDAKYGTRTWDLSANKYLMMAWGKTMADSSVMAHHDDLPAVSDTEVDLKSTKTYFSSAYHVMVKAHAGVMIVAWILVTGIVTVVARHYRDWLPKTRLFGTKVWFQIHRGLAVLVAILTGIGLALIFAHYGAEIREYYALPHAYVGLVLTACVGLQIIAGILRPDGNHKMRPVFNWAHRFLGQASHILAAATMFLAFDIKYITPDMKRFGFIALGVWVAVQVLWHLIFEFFSRRNTLTAHTDSISLDINSDDAGTVRAADDSTTYSLLFGTYIICLLGLAVAVLAAFLLF